jgi:hypothetical protein
MKIKMVETEEKNLPLTVMKQQQYWEKKSKRYWTAASMCMAFDTGEA